MAQIFWQQDSPLLVSRNYLLIGEAMRVPLFLDEQEVRYSTLLHPPAYTAQRRAKYLHVSGKQLAKSVLLRGQTGYSIAVLPATHQVVLQALKPTMGATVRIASDREIAEVFRDCEWGVRSPFGTLYGVKTILDDSFGEDDEIAFESHFHAVTIRMKCRDFESLEKPLRIPFAKPVD